MQLRIEARRVDHALAVLAFTLEQDFRGLAWLGLGALRGRRYRHGVAEEVPDVGPELEQSLVGGVFGPCNVLETFAGLGAEASKDAFGVALCFAFGARLRGGWTGRGGLVA